MMYRRLSPAHGLVFWYFAVFCFCSSDGDTLENLPFPNGSISEWFFPTIVKHIEILRVTDNHTENSSNLVSNFTSPANLSDCPAQDTANCKTGDEGNFNTTPSVLHIDSLPIERVEVTVPPFRLVTAIVQTAVRHYNYPPVTDIVGGSLLLESLVKLNNYICGEAGVCDDGLDDYGCKIAKCYPCRCDDDCLKFSDCCPDALTSSTPPPVDQGFNCVSQGFKDAETQPPKRYLMIGHCPSRELSQNLNETLWRLCENPNRRNPVEFTPVYSASTGLHYQNRYCALCSEMSEFESWTMNSFCTDYVDYNSMASLEDFQDFIQEQRTCGIYAFPTDIGNTRVCYYNDTMVTRCNVTGQWKEESYKDDVELGCSLFTQPVVINNVLYKNTVCALCNGVTVIRFDHCPNFQTRPSAAPFSVLLNFRQKDAVQIQRLGMSKNPECQDTEILDSYLNICRKLYCPVGKFPQNHTCNNMFDSAKGVGYILNYSLKPRNKGYAVIKDRLNMMAFRFSEQYSYSVRMAIGLSWYNIKLKYLYHEEESVFGRNRLYVKSIGVQFAVIVKNHIPRYRVESALMQFMKSGYFYYSIGNVTPELFSSEWLTDNDDLNFVAEKKEYINTTDELYTNMIAQTFIFRKNLFFNAPRIPEVFRQNTSAYIQMNEIMQCDHIELNSSEYHLQENGILDIQLGGKKRILYSGQYKMIGKRVRVCSEFSALSQTALDAQTEAWVFDIAETIVTIICTSCSLAGLAVTLIVYLIFPSLQSLPGKLNMALWSNLFLAQLLWVSLAAAHVPLDLCRFFGIAIHYFWLSTFSWKLVCGFHLYRTFHSPLKVLEESRSLKKYILFSQAFPMVIIGVYILVHFYSSQESDIGYAGRVIGLEHRLCFLSTAIGIGLAFALPVGVVILTNGYFFASFVRSIQKMSQLSKHTSKRDVKQRVLFLKLSFLLGFTWILGFIAVAFDAQIMWYIFTISNASLGVFIFMSFGMKKLCSCYPVWTDDNQTNGSRLTNKYHLSRQTNSNSSDRTKISNDVKDDGFSSHLASNVAEEITKKSLAEGNANDTRREGEMTRTC